MTSLAFKPPTTWIISVKNAAVTQNRVFDDGYLNLEQPASAKAVTEVSGIDRKTMARYNASSYEKNQFCQACSNPYDRHQEPPMAPKVSSDEVSFDTFSR